MKVLAITQARYGSTRLPAKILKEVDGQTLLEIHLRRILQARSIDALKIATTDEVKDCSKLVDTQKYQDIYLLFENYWLDEALAEEKKLAERGESGT